MKSGRIESSGDQALDGLWATVPLEPSVPSERARSQIMQAARHAVRRRPGSRSAYWHWGLVVAAAAALAGAVAGGWLRAGRGGRQEKAQATAPASSSAAGVDASLNAAGVTAIALRTPAGKTVPSSAPDLRLPPPKVDRHDNYVLEAFNANFQSKLDSSDDGQYLVGLLFDSDRHLLRVAGPEALPSTPPNPDQADPGIYATDSVARRFFGLGLRDCNGSTAISLPDPPVPGHPRFLVWAFTLRPDSVLKAEAMVRSATAQYFSGHLPKHDEGADVPLLTAVMTADGRFDRHTLEYRHVSAGSLAGTTFDADLDSRLAQLGLRPDDIGYSGTMMIGSEDLPGGTTGGFVIVSFAWPKAAAPPIERAPSEEQPSLDTRLAAPVLLAHFSPEQLLDNSDGNEAWLLLDRTGRVIASGRGPWNDPKRPLVMQLLERFPGISINENWAGSYPDPAVKGRTYDAAFFWLAEGSPLPP